MKVRGIVHLYWDDRYTSNLYLEVKFKLPTQFLYRTRKKCLASIWWVGEEYKDTIEFWSSCFETLSDKKYLEEVAKGIIISYIKEKYKETKSDINKRKIEDMIKKVNEEFIVEVEYKRS